MLNIGYLWIVVQIESNIGLRCIPRHLYPRFTEFPAFSVDPGLGFLDLHWVPIIAYCS